MTSRARFAIAVTALALVFLHGAASSAGTESSVDKPESEACDEARARQVAEIVQRRYDAMKGLAADFDQETRSVVLASDGIDLDGGVPESSRGRVTFAKPGRMRWEYREPEESYVISDGQVLWIHDVAAKQATRVLVGEEYLSGAALQFLLGDGVLTDTFVIAPLACRPGVTELELSPRTPASYERLGMTVDVESGLIVESSIVDLFGNRTRIRFENIVVDPSSPEGTFQFVPPPGTEVVDLSNRP